MSIKDSFTHLADDQVFFELTEFQGVVEVRLVEIFNDRILSDCYLSKETLNILVNAIEQHENNNGIVQ